MIAKKVNNIIAEVYGLDLNTHNDLTETSLLTSLGDSLDLVELVFALEAEFKFPEIEESDVERWKTVTDVINYCYNHIHPSVKRVTLVAAKPVAAKRVGKTKRVVPVKTPRIDLDEAYMQMAEIWAGRSYATRSKVGALMIKDRQIISDGYNGMPSGFPNDEVESTLKDGLIETNPLVLHAESNAILKCAKSGGVTSEGSTLYVTMTPCLQCCKLIIQSGIKKVFYRNAYRDMSSLEVLKRAGIPVVQLLKQGDSHE